MDLVLRTARLDQARALTDAMEREMQQRYGDGAAGPLDGADFALPSAAFVIADLDGVDVGCGGLRLIQPGVAVGELKRMYVEPAVRGQGVGRAVLRDLVDRARTAGLTRVLLEAGARQPEALGLYRSAGFMPVASYGHFRDEPLARCFALEL